MFSFQNPAGFLLLLLLPLFFILRKFKILNQTVIYTVLGDWEGKYFSWKGSLRKFFSILTKIMMGTGFFLTVFAFADPVISSQEKVYTSLGTDLIFVVDTSPSMAAADIDGECRIDSAKKAISELMKAYNGFRYGIVGLGSNASVIVPPTPDQSVFLRRMDEIKVGMLGNGSAIGDGLSTAVCHLASSSAPKKCIILLTDGENNAGEIHPETAAKLAADNKITLYVVGIGSKGRVPIEYTDFQSGKQYSGYLESDFNSNSLKKIAETGLGRYFEVRTIDELARSLTSVAKTELVEQTFTYKTITTSYYKKILFIAIILFLLTYFFKRFVLQEIIPFSYKKSLILRSIFQTAAFIMLLLAYADIRWGTYLAPIQKNNTAVSFVFDISNSMMAKDVGSIGNRFSKDFKEGIPRLKAAKNYAQKLMEHMAGTSISVVLAKGEGIAAIPLTEDYAMIDSLLEVMSPSLMTVPGSSLGKGILCAKNSFPENFSSAGRIWLFTDGEETDGALSAALLECMKSGIPLSIIGFGDEEETEILAGDGKTKVYSALRRENIERMIEEIHEKMSSYKNQTPLIFVNAAEKGSALKLLSQLSLHSQHQQEGGQLVSYEARPIPRYKFFLLLAFIFLGLGFFASEFDFKTFVLANKKSKSGSMAFFIVLSLYCMIVLPGCSESSDSFKILRGTYEWQKKNYRKAVSFYLDVAEKTSREKQQTIDYSLYDLAVAYAMTGEDKAALERYAEISSQAPAQVRYKAFYNAGIIAGSNGDFESAGSYFRKALEIDSSRLEAKINLELSIQMTESESKQNESQALPASQENPGNQDLENTVFQHIKENDKKQWKNSESNQAQNLSDDY